MLPLAWAMRAAYRVAPPEMRPLVSIIVNVFNGERYVAEALDSILALEGDFPLQVIVTDDCSTDGTSAILADYAKPPFEIIRFPANVGAAKAITEAFQHVRGEYVARLDYDDRFHPHFLTASVAALEAHPDAAFVCANAVMIDPDGKAGDTVGPFQYGESPGSADRFRSMLTRHFVTAPTILGRTSHWRRAMPIPAGMNFCDWYMNLTMAEQAPVVFLDRTTADYRVHPQGMHVTKIRDGMGERVTFAVLDRFLDQSPRREELRGVATTIRAQHYADWGNKYFSAGLDDLALRCYGRAISHDPRLAFNLSLARRGAGLLIGRHRYDWLKSRSKRLFRAPV